MERIRAKQGVDKEVVPNTVEGSGRRPNSRKILQFFPSFKLTNCYINMNISLPLKTGNLIINCVPLSPTNILCLKDSPHNLTKYEKRGLQKSQFPYSSVNWEKSRSRTNSEKNVFHRDKKNFKPIGNSTHTTTFLTLRKFDILMFFTCKMKALQVQVYLQK